MAFPTTLTNAVDGSTEILAEHLNNLETKIGINNSSVTTSLDYKLKNTLCVNPGHKHDSVYSPDGLTEVLTTDNSNNVVIATGSIGVGTSYPVKSVHIVGDVYANKVYAATSATTSKAAMHVINDITPSIKQTSSVFSSGYFLTKCNGTSAIDSSIAVIACVQENSQATVSYTKGVDTYLYLSGATGTITNASNIHISSPYRFSGNKSITNMFGVHIEQLNSALITNSYGIYQSGATDTNFFNGNIGVKTISPTTALDINSDTIRIRRKRTISATGTTGQTGEICFDSSYIYCCVATNSWKRATLATWS